MEAPAPSISIRGTSLNAWFRNVLPDILFTLLKNALTKGYTHLVAQALGVEFVRL